MAVKNADQEFVEFIVKALVDNPDDVKTERKVDEMGVLIVLRVNQDDMGTIIGRAGSTAKAIRTLTRIVGLKKNARVNLKIEEPEGSTRNSKPEEEKEATGKDVDKVVEDLKL